MTARCPACGAQVEEGAELCLECGEPIEAAPPPTPSPVTRLPPPPAPPTTKLPAVKLPVPPPPPRATVPPPTTPSPPRPPAPAATPPPGQRASPSSPTRNLRAVKPAREEEPEPRRCPGCGLKTAAARCPSCGTRLRSDDE